MIQIKKELLLIDLYARLPHGFIVHRYSDNVDIKINNIDDFSHFLEYSGDEKFKPYLRPMSSMTREEKYYIKYHYCPEYYFDVDLQGNMSDSDGKSIFEIELSKIVGYIDYLIANHFDYHGLIPMDLALEAPEGMYNIKEK